MTSTVKVAIDGIEYSLRGDDIDLIKATAEEVNKQIKSLKSQNGDIPNSTATILAALNIAEVNLKNQNKLDKTLSFITSELNKMSNLLENSDNT